MKDRLSFIFFLLSFQKIPLCDLPSLRLKSNNDAYGNQPPSWVQTGSGILFPANICLLNPLVQSHFRPIHEIIADGHQDHLHVSIPIFCGKLCAENETERKD